MKQTDNEISNEEQFKEHVKYLKSERKFSDTQIQKIRKEVIKLLDRTKNEILNAEIEELKESIDNIWFLRSELIDYLIKTKRGIPDTELKKLRNSDKKYNTMGFIKETD